MSRRVFPAAAASLGACAVVAQGVLTVQHALASGQTCAEDPFVDVAKLGCPKVFASAAAFVVFFASVWMGLLAIARARAVRRCAAPAPESRGRA